MTNQSSNAGKVSGSPSETERAVRLLHDTAVAVDAMLMAALNAVNNTPNVNYARIPLRRALAALRNTDPTYTGSNGAEDE